MQISATLSLQGPFTTSRTPLPASKSTAGTRRYGEQACGPRGQFMWLGPIFRKPHTNWRGGTRPCARDGPRARGNSTDGRWVYEGGEKKRRKQKYRTPYSGYSGYSAPGRRSLRALAGRKPSVILPGARTAQLVWAPPRLDSGLVCSITSLAANESVLASQFGWLTGALR